jgi:NADP-dependent 3-hydroxy acid dehydrogenase YdfG
MSIKNNTTNDWNLVLSNKVVFLTGGAGWIARHIAKTCYDHGARIVLADLNINTINKIKDEIFGSENIDDRVLAIQLDVQDEETIKKAVHLTLDKWNTIDIVINTFVEIKSIFIIIIFFINYL